MPSPTPFPFPSLLDVGNPLEWRQISRSEAHHLSSHGHFVAVTTEAGAASRFDGNSACWRGDGPYLYDTFSYFVLKGSRPWPRSLASRGRARDTTVEAQPVPSETPEILDIPETRDRSPARSPHRASAPPSQPAARGEKPESHLRFDLALDPAVPGFQDDVFVLASQDGSYRQTRTVKDDQVPGDGKLSLLFSGVAEGKAYALSRIHAGEEIPLIPEVRYAPSKPDAAAGPGEAVGCKVVIRECRIRGEREDLYQEKESEYLIDLVPAAEKWVYVFGGPKGKPFRLLAEGLGLEDGSFRPVPLAPVSDGRGSRDVGGPAGTDGSRGPAGTDGGRASAGSDGSGERRQPLETACSTLTLPLEVNGESWDLYACLSPFRLSEKRIAVLCRDPRARCYQIGADEGGILWSPDHVGRASSRLLGLYTRRDPRVKEAASDAFLLGLIDPMAEARRRAVIYQKCVEPYLESRFDAASPSGHPDATARRRKYVAGLLKVLTEKHPEKARLRAALAERGRTLETFLVEEDRRESALRRKAEKAGAALVKWMDAPSGLFEAALYDSTADPDDTQCAQSPGGLRLPDPVFRGHLADAAVFPHDRGAGGCLGHADPARRRRPPGGAQADRGHRGNPRLAGQGAGAAPGLQRGSDGSLFRPLRAGLGVRIPDAVEHGAADHHV